MRFFIVLFLSLYLAFSQSHEEFQRRIEEIRTVKVVFVQSVQYPWQSKPDVSKGVFYAQKGGKFRIEYEQPDKSLIVSDGSQVMVYFHKDKTAFIEPIQKNTSPVVEALFLLSRPISEVFQLIGDMESSRGKTFIFKPKVKDDYFSRVFVEVTPKGDIRSIKVEEKEGIVTTIQFLNMVTNFTPSENLFKVRVPEGAKLMRP